MKSIEDLWALVDNIESFPNLTLLVRVVRSIPTSTADCERGFSLMKRYKTDLRSSLSIRLISDTMTLKCNEEEYQLFDAGPFVESWWKKTSRRAYQSDKPKKMPKR